MDSLLVSLLIPLASFGLGLWAVLANFREKQKAAGEKVVIREQLPVPKKLHLSKKPKRPLSITGYLAIGGLALVWGAASLGAFKTHHREEVAATNDSLAKAYRDSVELAAAQRDEVALTRLEQLACEQEELFVGLRATHDHISDVGNTMLNQAWMAQIAIDEMRSPMTLLKAWFVIGFPLELSKHDLTYMRRYNEGVNPGFRKSLGVLRYNMVVRSDSIRNDLLGLRYWPIHKNNLKVIYDIFNMGAIRNDSSFVTYELDNGSYEYTCLGYRNDTLYLGIYASGDLTRNFSGYNIPFIEAIRNVESRFQFSFECYDTWNNCGTSKQPFVLGGIMFRFNDGPMLALSPQQARRKSYNDTIWGVGENWYFPTEHYNELLYNPDNSFVPNCSDWEYIWSIMPPIE